MGKDLKLSLGNLDIERDWGWAPEYVQAIATMLEQPSPEDCIIATGQSHALREFVKTAFELIGKDWRVYVRKIRIDAPCGYIAQQSRSFKGGISFGWKARYGMKEVIGMMLDAEMKSLRENHPA